MQSQAKKPVPVDVTLVAAEFPELTDWKRLSDEPEEFRATSSTTGIEVRVSFAPLDDRINAERILAVQRRIEHSAGEVLGVEKIIDAVDLQNGATAIVTAFTAGETLEREIARGPIHWDDATWMTMELAKILAHLHERNVTYGALHPSNVFLASGAIPILRSLELSMLGRPDEIVAEDGPANPFMPPELERSAITPRIDVYGLGAALRSMLAGDVGAFHANVSTDLPLDYEQTPSEILAVVDKATATNPADRYADAAEFRRALEPAISLAFERERTRAAISFPDSAFSRSAAAAAAAAAVGGSVGAFEVPGAREATSGRIVDLRSGAQPFQVDRRRPRSNGVFDRLEPASLATVPPIISLPAQAGVALPSEPAAQLAAVARPDGAVPGATYVEALRERTGLILITAALVLVGLASFGYASISDGPPDEIAATEDESGSAAAEEPDVRDSDAAVQGDEADEEGLTDSGLSELPQNVVGLPDIVVGATGSNDRSDVSGQGTPPASASPSSPPRAPVRTVPPRSTPAPTTVPNVSVAGPIVGPPPTSSPQQPPGTSGAPTTQPPAYDPPVVEAPPTQTPAPTATTQVPTTLAPTTLAPTTLAPTTLAPTTLAPTTSGPISGPALVLDAVANPDFESVTISFRTSDCASVSYSISGGGSLSSSYGGSCVTDHSVRLGGVPYNGTQLRPSTAYTVTITTTSRSGQVSSRNVSFTTKAQPEAPLAISNLRVSEITETTARVSFTANKCVGSSFVVTGGGSGRYDWGYPNTNHCLTDQWGTIGYFQSSRLLAGADNTVTVTARTKDGESVTKSITFFVPAG